MKKNDWAVLDGEFIKTVQPAVPVNSRGLMYGDGLFETFRVTNGQIFFLEEHIKRLKAGLNFLGISLPEELQSKKTIFLMRELLQKQSLLEEDAIIRLQIWRGGQRGYQPMPGADAHFSVTASECRSTFDAPMLSTVSRRRIPSEALPSKYKFTNGINYIAARKEAVAKGADDALMQTIDKWISETTIANIFWIRDDNIFTPSEACDLLPGITRRVFINLIKKLPDWKFEQGKYAVDELYWADAVWICNSIREILPVKGVNEHQFDLKHPVFNELRSSYKECKHKNSTAVFC